jgi:putative transcriptional regulator
MPYTPISIDRKALTIMDVPFPDLQTLENTADAIGSNMFEGFQPTKKVIQLYLDWKLGKFSDGELLPRLSECYEK